MTTKSKINKIKAMASKTKIIMLAFGFFVAALMFSGEKAEAATLNFNLDKKEAVIGEVIPLEVLLNAENGEDLNAINLRVGIQNNGVKLKDWSDGGSIINYWAERPNIDQDGNLAFQGVMLGGFRGANGRLITLYYEALKAGKATINFKPGVAVYLNDGKGTEANLNFKGAAITVSSKTGQIQGILVPDIAPPETLEAQISNSKDIYDGQYFLAFAAQDGGSGIDYVEIKEGDGLWVRAESPYLLTNQNLDQDILVKAVDKNGNARIEALKLKQYQLIKNSIYAVALLAVVLAVWRLFKRRKIK